MSNTDPPSPFDPKAYRNVLGGFGTGVALVAARDAAGRAHGVIINSFTSVSLEPPIVLWCVANANKAFEIYTACDTFSINILRSEDHELARRFSRSGDRTLPEDQLGALATGAPVLLAAVATLDCRMRQRQPMGDHEVIYGDVVAFRGDPGVNALGFFRGRYVTLRSGEA